MLVWQSQNHILRPLLNLIGDKPDKEYFSWFGRQDMLTDHIRNLGKYFYYFYSTQKTKTQCNTKINVVQLLEEYHFNSFYFMGAFFNPQILTDATLDILTKLILTKRKACTMRSKTKHLFIFQSNFNFLLYINLTTYNLCMLSKMYDICRSLPCIVRQRGKKIH